jgi:Uma2 family endonuclease
VSETHETSPRRRRPLDYSEWEIGPEDVAESCEQGEIIKVLRSSLEQLVLLRGWKRVFVGADNYFAWDRAHPMVRVSPDVYLLDDPPARLPKMWRTWIPGSRPPRWALEIVSEDWRKDYDEDPRKYEALGCLELAVFDPDAAMGSTRVRRRVALTIYRRTAEGKLATAYAGPGPALSHELGVWLVPSRAGYSARLRLSEDRAGKRIIPTFEEGLEAERALRQAAEKARDEVEKRVARLERALRKKPR